MSSPELDMQALQQLRGQFSQALKDFASSSSSSFRILHSIPPATTAPTPSSPIVTKTVYVLDSSFNPPSKAHSSLVKTALKSQTKNSTPRVLFLLASVNADKKPKPADFEDRLVMMTLAAEDLRSAFNTPAPIIDIGITKEPYFVDKATAIDASGLYRPPGHDPSSPTEDDDGVVEQIHLTGFDTLLRIFTPKYYPNSHPPLSALEPFLRRHRLRATIRVDANSPSQNLKDAQKTQPESSLSAGSQAPPDLTTIAGQEAYLDSIKNGSLEKDGLKREWAERVELVVDDSGETEGVSSTKIRNAMKDGDWDEVKGLVGQKVGEWIRHRGLYLEGGKM
ncbi:uncharacterized protein Z520_09192 [Fonsecaea multimorphosa CBS 102226]|uniref:Nicotinamide-nucleotide adenylyltransferase n=1 Tax=Fonsecaea multimorphosa CBS 102226 TaxID=1442371 RepID=A0A0D2H0D2_9EURO|nr:uncharacterized protein Z520_09192 [Fonsecaea multimorphosa CBS 102226]KIX95275.1 hypothetical protein Z520_09192 [Fonsecaea multimorphosa CBS 102226]OAL17236.1 hypothetical protein AYO22_11801 [Fonsecaea multimorphosa]